MKTTSNGKLLLSLVERYNLVIVNGTEKCSGIITRMRRKGQVTEKSVIDFFIVCQALYQMVTQMQVDEDRKMVLTKFYKNKGRTIIKESDHNPLSLNLDISWNSKVVKKREEIYNLRNIECQQTFFKYTNESNVLTSCLINKDIASGSRLWIRNLKYIIMQTFRKIQLNWKDKSQLKIEAMVEQRFKGADKSVIDGEIATRIFDRNRKLIIGQVSDMSDMSCNLSRVNMWKVKQKVCPAIETTCPVAKMNKDQLILITHS